ncbi:MAG: UvrD-helicase domain-containing protein [Chitinophagales bacterium]|nr:UvrD-helicase domain-containing protein [Chitinophagales bacterium]MDW8420107.1 3'-5' exonuclease [Chitinophagales bacterium]
MNYLEELNDVQREAVLSTEGPTQIIAGPGSGKTRVLTYRIAHLINIGVDPFSILALTFTNKAAENMRRRIESICGAKARGLFMGTFHSVFARVLRVEAPKMGYPPDFTIYDTDDSRSLIKSIIKERNLDDKIYKPALVQWRISAAKNSLITPDMYAADPDLRIEDERQRRPETSLLYKMYCDRCFKAGAMDFDDLLLNTHLILDKFPEVLYKYQHKFRYVLIDEFQDTNFVQYDIVRRIADVFHNITVVGDDAQSIYAFRGATIDNILHFTRDYPDCKVFKLEQNYRSTQVIVKAANELIHNNKNQLQKEIWTRNEKGEPIKIIKTPSDNDEGRWVTDSILELCMRDHYRYSDFAILYRTNAQSRAFEEALRRHNVPYRIYGGMSFYQRKEIKDYLAYLKLTINPHDEEALKRIINYPARGIGQTTIDKITITAVNENKSMWDVIANIRAYNVAPRTLNAIEEFALMINSFRALLSKMNAYDLALHIGKTTKLIAELYSDKTVEGVNRYENVQELLNSIKEFTEDDEVTSDDALPADKGLGAFLQNVALLTGDEKEKSNTDTVKLMTVHAAKGLEFPVVYVVGLEENLFPSMQSLYSAEDLEEERRLFYVAITRAEKKLFLTYANTRYRNGQLHFSEPSRFIDEIPRELTNYAGIAADKNYGPAVPSWRNSTPPRANTSHTSSARTHTPPAEGPFTADDPALLQAGMEVFHEKFGEGKIIAIEGAGTNRIAAVQFADLGIKKIMLKFARLKIIRSGV